MKPKLLFRDRDFDMPPELCHAHETVKTDLGLDYVLRAMAREDAVIYSVCETALFTPPETLDDISYRQENLKDALVNARAVRRLYEITEETISRKEKLLFTRLDLPNLTRTVSTAIRLLELYTEMLASLRSAADSHLEGFSSAGFTGFLSLLQREMTDEYFAEVRAHLDELSGRDGVSVRAEFGSYLQGVGYTLVSGNKSKARRAFQRNLSYVLGTEDKAAYKEIERRHDYAVNDAANALAQAAEHLGTFFTLLRHELGFYVGCLNLADTLASIGMKYCVPEMLSAKSFERSYDELFDVGLAVVKGASVVGNALSAKDIRLYIITGANQGGKTTFLRSLGQAQLMAQCGMIAGAKSFVAPICRGVFTHFTKEEDATMQSGKLEEELCRMDEIANRLQPGALVLFNESFAATNEREGSEIHQQIVRALVENDVEVFSVTHLTLFAAAFSGSETTRFLRAQWLENNVRTFKLVPEEPRKSSFDAGLFESVFGDFETGVRKPAFSQPSETGEEKTAEAPDAREGAKKDEVLQTDSADHLSGTGFGEDSDFSFVSERVVRRKQAVKALKSRSVFIVLLLFLLVIPIYTSGRGVKVNTRSPFVIIRNEVFFSHMNSGFIMYKDFSGNNAYTLRNDNCSFLTEDEGLLYYSVIDSRRKGDAADFGVYRVTLWGERWKLTSDAGQYVQAEDNTVVYAFDGDIYSVINFGHKEPEKLTDRSHSAIADLIVFDGRIYYNADSSVCAMNLDGTGHVVLSEDDGVMLCTDGDWLYYINRGDSNALYKIRTDGSEREFLRTDPGVSAGMSVDKGWLYFVNRKNGNRIYRMRTDGYELTRLSKNRTFFDFVPEIRNGLIHYVNVDKGNRLYEMRPDGSAERMVTS